MKDVLRFITCGSVDDGKSTLIGRLLWETGSLYLDQLEALKKDSLKHGTQGEDIDYALLLDGLSAEREQGITIDVAYRFFSTPNRRFIIADCPGHLQYTRNMITAASTADAAIILIDASKGISPQTKRHTIINHLMGVKHLIIAINKMDLVNYNKDVFETIQKNFLTLLESYQFSSVEFIPLSALKGDNLLQKTHQMKWYQGPTLLSYLDLLKIQKDPTNHFVFPVQTVIRPDSQFRGFAGRIAHGNIEVGKEIRVNPSGAKAKIKDIVRMDTPPTSAITGDSVVLTLDKEIDISRGDVLSLADQPVESSYQFEATLVWLSDQQGFVGRQYDLKLSHQWTIATISNLKHKINIEEFRHEPVKHLELNDIASIQFSTAKPLCFLPYEQSKELGGFILVDRLTKKTLAAGTIHFSLRRASNIYQHDLNINRNKREELNLHPAKVLWFTGLSGSGKSTIANALELALYDMGKKTYILDGDNIRHGLNKDLGFTEADRVENIRRVAEVAKLMFDAGLIVMVSFISPYADDRKMARELIGEENFIEIYLSTPLDICEKRDTKGLYQKARQGKLQNLTGVGSPYEVPQKPHYVFDTSTQNLEEIVTKLQKDLFL